MSMRRWSLAWILALLWLIGGIPGVAVADPPGPTDYLSEVVEVEPFVGGFEVEIIGGDSFVLLRVNGGTNVEVVGYQGEPYLRFLKDGTVEENSVSPSKYLNEERYGGDLPAAADASAAPVWRVVADDGSYAWHDHRTHWMNPQPPPGLGPGDQVAEGVVPLLVDGVEVDVTVKSVWQRPPSPVPVAFGLTTGTAVAYAAFTWRRKQVVWVVLILAAAATVMGTTAYLSVPSETGPIWSLWVLPVTSLLFAGAVALGRSREGLFYRRRSVLLLVAAFELVAWGVLHWGWLWPAIIPTAAPFWLDRFVAAVVLAGSVGSAAAIVAAADRTDLVGNTADG